MSSKPTLKIIPFTNPSGVIAHRVSGTISGLRMQKNFASFAEARRFMDGLLASSNQGGIYPQRIASTSLQTEAELREAELAWSRLRTANPKGSLITAVDYYLANAGQTLRDADAKESLDEFIERRRERGNKEKTLQVSRAMLAHFLNSTRIKLVSQITREKAESWVYDKSVGMRTRRDRHDQLHNFAEFLVKQHRLARNPTLEMDRPKVSYDGVITTLKPEQVLKLLREAARLPVGRDRAHGRMLAYFAVTALSGVRPDEARRLGPDWRWFSEEKRLITGFRAKTSNRPRTVEISSELVEILVHCRNQKCCPADFSTKAFIQIRSAAGVFELWDNDILRHTYASHHYACRRDIGWLQKNMGNSEDVLKRAYLDQTVVADQGEQLFRITLAAIRV